MEQVVKSGEILMELYGLSQSQSTEFCRNGITGKIVISQTAYDFQVECYASFLRTTAQVDCSAFNFHVKVVHCPIYNYPVILASESAFIPGNQDHSSVRGIQIKIPLCKIPKMGIYDYDDTLRVVLNVDVVAVKHPKPLFLKRFQSAEDSDVQLICENEIFPVHTFILKTVSPVFRKMLEAPMKEAATGQIVIKDLSADTVKNMVDYIYHGSMNIGSDAQIIEGLYAAEKYGLDSFKTACLERMITSMSDENITAFLEMSVRVNAGNEFITQMVDYCMTHIKELRKREDFPDFFRANPSVFLENWQTR